MQKLVGALMQFASTFVISRVLSLGFVVYLAACLPTARFACGQQLAASLAPTATASAAAAEEVDAVSAVRMAIEQYASDIDTLDHRFRVPLDSAASQRRATVMKEWLAKLDAIPTELLGVESHADWLLLHGEISYQIEKLARDSAQDHEAALEFIPYAADLVQFCKAREDVEEIKPTDLAGKVDDLATVVSEAIESLTQTDMEDQSKETVDRRLRALRASRLVSSLYRTAYEAHRFYEGYDPQYTWWLKQPMKRLLELLDQHQRELRTKEVGLAEDDKDTIIGLPIGDEGLELELKHEWIAHTPAELIKLAEVEMAWCEEQMRLASNELGYGDDWRAAMEFVKSKHVAPGEQPKMIRDLAWEAIRFLEAHDLVTVPSLAATGWRMDMMSPERQRVNPYFLGGDTIIVSFPTDSMTHEEKLMSMRSNNEHFSRATVHHELIPGHHLQFHMLPRYRPYRKLFSTPFWIEGWALYWEMLLWDLDFAHGPEDRVGMLFWRKHRCARIIFSLGYHSGKMSPEECVDYLVDKVGHERSAAAAEVRRSIMGGYSPLYQAAYMLGGLQIRQMHEEMVQGGGMTNRQFHDAILQEHAMPIEMLRRIMKARFGDQPLEAGEEASWRFADGKILAAE